jgi:Flp pilus assembly protein TadG
MAASSRRGARVRRRARPGAAGQSTVEFALVLPLFFALLVLLIQVALVMRDEILVVHAARSAVREASVTADPSRIATAATRTLPGAVVSVTRRGAVGEPVDVDVSYVTHTDLPLVGVLLPDLTLHGHAVMRVER